MASVCEAPPCPQPHILPPGQGSPHCGLPMRPASELYAGMSVRRGFCQSGSPPPGPHAETTCVLESLPPIVPRHDYAPCVCLSLG